MLEVNQCKYSNRRVDWFILLKRLVRRAGETACRRPRGAKVALRSYGRPVSRSKVTPWLTSVSVTSGATRKPPDATGPALIRLLLSPSVHSCFLSLLLVAAVVWKIKQSCWASRRREVSRRPPPPPHTDRLFRLAECCVTGTLGNVPTCISAVLVAEIKPWAISLWWVSLFRDGIVAKVYDEKTSFIEKNSSFFSEHWEMDCVFSTSF